MTTSTARQAFQEYLSQALDTYHPRWETGIKGKEQRSSNQEFRTVACETLRDWVNSVKSQCPQQKSFQAFLDEAEFPEETLNMIWTLYLAFKRERKQRGQRRTSLEQFTTGQAALSSVAFLQTTKVVSDHDTMSLVTPTLQKEPMHEQNDHSELNVDAWKDKIERQGADRIEGLTGVDAQIFVKIGEAFDDEIQRIANNSTLKDTPSDVLADAMLKGLHEAIATLSKTKIVMALDRLRKS